jgi:hypothetical protein
VSLTEGRGMPVSLREACPETVHKIRDAMS